MRDLVSYSDGLLLTLLIVWFAADYFPIFWGSGLASIDDEIIDFTQKGGWHKIDSVDVRNKILYEILVKNFSQLTEGLKVRIGDFSLFYPDGN